jgi:hypothetical protein
MAVKHYDFVIKGESTVLCAYLEGFLRGKGIKSGYFFTEDYPIQSHYIKELIKYHGDVVHLICRSNLRPAIRSAIPQSAGRFIFEIKESKSLTGATFDFKFKTASRPVGGIIKRLLGRHPAGVKLVNYEPKEIVDPDAKGPEGYAPLHEYTFGGRGTIVGDIEGVLKVYEKLECNEFIDCDDIEIVY